MRGVPGTENIAHYKSIDRYLVVKTMEGKLKRLATGRTLIEALMMRDWCKVNNWRKFIYRHQYIQKNRSGSYGIYKDFKDENGNNYRLQFGTFNTFEEAQKERDLLIKYDWDFEALCALE